VWEARYPDPLVVMMGSEGPGLADADLRRGSLQVSIPMTGTAESLNLAVATGVVLFEVLRQRRDQARG
jgi:tRNA G18 (ribose-2'-O)-methylase SpoU